MLSIIGKQWCQLFHINLHLPACPSPTMHIFVPLSGFCLAVLFFKDSRFWRQLLAFFLISFGYFSSTVAFKVHMLFWVHIWKILCLANPRTWAWHYGRGAILLSGKAKLEAWLWFRFRAEDTHPAWPPSEAAWKLSGPRAQSPYEGQENIPIE